MEATNCLQKKECKIRISEVIPENFKGYRIWVDGAGFVKFTIGECPTRVERIGFDITPPDKDWDQIAGLIFDQLEQINLEAASPCSFTLGQPLLETVSAKLQEYFKDKSAANMPLFSLSASVGPATININPIFEPVLDEVVPADK